LIQGHLAWEIISAHLSPLVKVVEKITGKNKCGLRNQTDKKRYDEIHPKVKKRGGLMEFQWRSLLLNTHNRITYCLLSKTDFYLLTKQENGGKMDVFFIEQYTFEPRRRLSQDRPE
jgi:hypothetical protein